METYMIRKDDKYLDDQRLYLCISKYDKIVNKFDEFNSMVDNVTKAPKRNSRGSSSNSRRKTMRENGRRSVKASERVGKEKSCTNGIDGSTFSSIRVGVGDTRTESEVLVEFITNHILDLNSPHHKSF